MDRTRGVVRRLAAEREASRSPDLAHVRGLRPLGALLEFEFHLLAFRQAPEPLRLDGGVVDEHVLAAVVRRDESEALRIIEPLHGPVRHCSHSPSGMHPSIPARTDLLPAPPMREPPAARKVLRATLFRPPVRTPASRLPREARYGTPRRLPRQPARCSRRALR